MSNQCTIFETKFNKRYLELITKPSVRLYEFTFALYSNSPHNLVALSYFAAYAVVVSWWVVGNSAQLGKMEWLSLSP